MMIQIYLRSFYTNTLGSVKEVLFASAHDNSGEGVTAAAVTAQMMERTSFRKFSTYLALLLLVKGALVKDLYYTGTETKLLIILEKRGKGIVTVKL